MQEFLENLWRNGPDSQGLVAFLEAKLSEEEDIYELHTSLIGSHWQCSPKRGKKPCLTPGLLQAIEQDSFALFEIERTLSGTSLRAGMIHELYERNAWSILYRLMKNMPDRMIFTLGLWDTLIVLSSHLGRIAVGTDFQFTTMTRTLRQYLWLKKVRILPGITRVPNGAFAGCKHLAHVEIPGSVREIGPGAFYHCTDLKSIVIPEGVATIGQYAFLDCKGLETVVISKGLTTIEDGAFCDCTSLKSIQIPESVKRIGKYAFKGCPIEKSVLSLGWPRTLDP